MSENYYFTSQLMSSEFNAENLNFNIKFQKKLTKINLISFCIGPFNILEKKNLPLWISFLLEKAKFGKISTPYWLDNIWLKKKVAMELNEENLEIVPRNYIEFFYIIYKNNINFVENLFKQIILLEELFAVRINKLLSGLAVLRIPIRALKLENIGEIELINFRQVLQLQLQSINYVHSCLKLAYPIPQMLF